MIATISWSVLGYHQFTLTLRVQLLERNLEHVLMSQANKGDDQEFFRDSPSESNNNNPLTPSLVRVARQASLEPCVCSPG